MRQAAQKFCGSFIEEPATMTIRYHLHLDRISIFFPRSVHVVDCCAFLRGQRAFFDDVSHRRAWLF